MWHIEEFSFLCFSLLIVSFTFVKVLAVAALPGFSLKSLLRGLGSPTAGVSVGRKGAVTRNGPWVSFGDENVLKLKDAQLCD